MKFTKVKKIKFDEVQNVADCSLYSSLGRCCGTRNYRKGKNLK